ncbi:hypothetical protein Tco_0709073, partial [Tanacetum coccineum]
TESEPEEAPSKIEEFLPLVSRAPFIDEEFKASKPLDTRITSSHSTAPSDSTTLLSPGHPLTQTAPAPTLFRPLYYRRTARMAVHTQPAMSPGLLARIPSPSLSLTLPIRKRCRGTSELVEDTKDESSDSDTEGEGSEDEGPGSEDEGPDSEEEEEAAPEGQQQTVPVVDTVADKPLGLGYEVLRRRELALGESSVPSTFKIGQSSSFTIIPVVPTLVASLVTTPAATIAVGEDELLEERATLTFDALWRPILALDSWAGHADAQRVEMWKAKYDDQRLIHDLLVQCELQETRDHVTTLEQERSRREQ